MAKFDFTEDDYDIDDVDLKDDYDRDLNKEHELYREHVSARRMTDDDYVDVGYENNEEAGSMNENNGNSLVNTIANIPGLAGIFGLILSVLALIFVFAGNSSNSALQDRVAELEADVSSLQAQVNSNSNKNNVSMTAATATLSASDKKDIADSVLARIGEQAEANSTDAQTALFTEAQKQSIIEDAVEKAMAEFEKKIEAEEAASANELSDRLTADENAFGDIRYVHGSPQATVPEAATNGSPALEVTYIGTTCGGNLIKQYNFGSDGYWVNQVVSNTANTGNVLNMTMSDEEIEAMNRGDYNDRVIVKVEKVGDTAQTVIIGGRSRTLESAEAVMPLNGTFYLGSDGSYTTGYSQYDANYAFVIFNFTDGRAFYAMPAETAKNIGRFFYVTNGSNAQGSGTGSALNLTADEQAKLKLLLTDSILTNDEIVILKRIVDSVEGSPLSREDVRTLKDIIYSVDRSPLSRDQYDNLKRIIRDY